MRTRAKKRTLVAAAIRRREERAALAELESMCPGSTEVISQLTGQEVIELGRWATAKLMNELEGKGRA